MENIIYNKDGWMIVDVQSKEDIEKYGPEDIQSELIQDWARIFRDGDFYIIISGYDRWFIFKDKNGKKTYYDRDFDNIDKEDFKSELEYNEFTDFQFISDNIIGYGKLYQLLAKIAKGEEVDRYSYGDYDKLIYDIRIDREKPMRSKITIVFEDEDEFLELFDISEDDKWIVRSAGSYDGHEFIDDWTAKNDWEEGYILPYINEENRQRINDIVKILSPGIDVSNDEEVAQVLQENFEVQVEGIYTDYRIQLNAAGNQYLNNLIKNDFENVFEHRGIVSITPMYKYLTSVSLLLKLMTKLFKDKDMTIYDIFNRLAPKVELSFGIDNLNDYPYQGDFDGDSFNRDVNYYLDIIDKNLEEILEEYLDPQEFRRIYDEITSKYEFGKYYPHPLDKDKQDKSTFVINNIDHTNNKLTVTVYNPDGSEKDTRSLTMDEFTRFLNQYELFESVENFHKRIILEQLNNNQDKILVKSFMDTLTPSTKELTKDDINFMINRYNLQNPQKPKLNLDKVLNTPTDSKFKIKLLGIPTFPNGEQKVIKTAELGLNDRFTITVERNPISGQTLPGIKINF